MWNRFKAFFGKHTNIFYTIAALVVIFAIFGGRVFRNNQSNASEENQKTGIKILSLSDYRNNNDFVLSSGTVESFEQMDMRSQTSANVAKVYVSIGDSVKQGQLLVTLQNADISASLSQAKANLDAQEARLEEIKNGTRPESLDVSLSQLHKAKSDLTNLYGSAVNVLNDAYVKADDAVGKQIAPLFSNANGSSPDLSFITSDSQSKIDSQAAMVVAVNSLNKFFSEINSLNEASDTSKSDSALNNSLNYLNDVKNLLNKTSTALQGASALPQVALDGYKAALNLARGNVNIAITEITSESQQIQSQKLNIDTVTKQYDLLLAGSVPEEIKTQEAVVAQARANVDSVSAQYQKIIFRSPIDGKVSAVPVSAGDLVSPGTLVVSVVNPNGEKITAYVSGEDAMRVKEGAEVLIGGQSKGIVSRVSPSIDPTTKKVELTILIPQADNLVVGEYVDVKITASPSDGASTNSFFVPIQAVKVSDAGSSVFLYDGTTTAIKEIPVTMGTVSGEFVEITGSLPADGKIVSPSYGLKDGAKVTVQ